MQKCAGRAVAFKDASGEPSMVMSSSSRLSLLNRITSLKEQRRADALQLLELWCSVGQSGVSKPVARACAVTTAELQKATLLKRHVVEAREPTRVAAILAQHNDRIVALGMSSHALEELVTDLLLLSERHQPRASSEVELSRLVPSVMSARAQGGLTPEGLVKFVDRAIGLPSKKNYFSYRRALHGSARTKR